MKLPVQHSIKLIQKKKKVKYNLYHKVVFITINYETYITYFVKLLLSILNWNLCMNKYKILKHWSILKKNLNYKWLYER